MTATTESIRIGKSRSGFSLVELVVAILIIAVLAAAVFFGGSAIIKRAQVQRVTSDLHNFEIAATSALNENPSVTNITTNALSEDGKLMKLITMFNDALPQDYKMVSTSIPMSTTPASENRLIRVTADTPTSGSYLVFQSNKTDAWQNHYYIIFDCAERYTDSSDFFITVLSAGPNAQANVGGNIDSDDIFLIAENSNRNVRTQIYNCDEIEEFYDMDNDSPITISGRSTSTGTSASYSGASGRSITARTKTSARKSKISTAISSVTGQKTLSGLSAYVGTEGKQVYQAGEYFSRTGLVVTAEYSDGSSAKITGYTVDNEASALIPGQSIRISYSENGKTVTAILDGVYVTADGSMPATTSTLTVSILHEGSADQVTSGDPAAYGENVSITFDATTNLTGGVIVVYMTDPASGIDSPISSGTSYSAINGNEQLYFTAMYRKDDELTFLKSASVTLYAASS